MTQPKQRYNSAPEVTIRPETLRNAANWTPPTVEEIEEVLNRARINWSQLAVITGNQESVVTNWKEGKEKISYLAWRYICERAGYGRIDRV
ncbi:hypothetical protein [Cronobacter sakazakii]|uniref:hypothetical protein n=1 Tax=Cronobacter sakazakii TaxID=28141 RepID=UPI0009BB807E|nr:hypothetical protein [Cronobacter sakazakii]MDK1224520.1 hypothetical protein [Cronobacter turicensis]EMC4401984.1 hypothetical protein [Cronobacter sakazakii]KAB0805797.1 hypothetical protein FZI15_22370 [Cronobacter sakazakii]KAB0886652.1 hypothetical protein FZI07_21770 [Cronobacter sakazakii]KAB0900852.1 hypothetical protein FZI05_19530 [Cronobacter sakazakii]